MTISTDQLQKLLGKNKDESYVLEVIQAISAEAVFEKVVGTYYCVLEEDGLDIGCDDNNNIRGILLHADGHEGYEEFKGKLPYGLDFEMSRKEVNSLLGLPGREGGGIVDRGDLIPPWDKYYMTDLAVHVMYTEDESSICRITISMPGQH